MFENLCINIVDSANSYGAYAISFADEHTLKELTPDVWLMISKLTVLTLTVTLNLVIPLLEGQALIEALIAKSEWTDLAVQQ